MSLGMRVSTSRPLSAEHKESTMLPWWQIYPSILQILVNHPPLQISMPNLHKWLLEPRTVDKWWTSRDSKLAVGEPNTRRLVEQ